MLIAMIVMWDVSGTTDITQLLKYEFESEPFLCCRVLYSFGASNLFVARFFASFAVKLPMFPVHNWL